MCGVSFPSNHLITVQLVHQIEQFQQTGQYVDNRPKYFAMLSLIPGSEGNGGDRGYEFQNNITMKFSLMELMGFAETLAEIARGNIYVLPFVKFAKSAGNTKSLTIMHKVKDNQYSPTGKEANLVITVSENKTKKNAISLAPFQALGFSKSLIMLADKGMKLDLERQINAPRQSQNQSRKQETVVLNTANNIPNNNQQQTNYQSGTNNSNTVNNPNEAIPNALNDLGNFITR